MRQDESLLTMSLIDVSNSNAVLRFCLDVSLNGRSKNDVYEISHE